MSEYLIHASWDAEAKVWVATSDDVPGLVTEADTLEALDSKLQVMVPELLAANTDPLHLPSTPITINVRSSR